MPIVKEVGDGGRTRGRASWRSGERSAGNVSFGADHRAGTCTFRAIRGDAGADTWSRTHFVSRCPARDCSFRDCADEYHLLRAALSGGFQSEGCGGRVGTESGSLLPAVRPLRWQDARLVLDDVRRKRLLSDHAGREAGRRFAGGRDLLSTYFVADGLRYSARLSDLGWRHTVSVCSAWTNSLPTTAVEPQGAAHHGWNTDRGNDRIPDTRRIRGSVHASTDA